MAFWTSLIPIGVTVAAAIFLGIADNDQSSECSHNSQDGLGALSSRNGFGDPYYSNTSGRSSSRLHRSHSSSSH